MFVYIYIHLYTVCVRVQMQYTHKHIAAYVGCIGQQQGNALKRTISFKDTKMLPLT